MASISSFRQLCGTEEKIRLLAMKIFTVACCGMIAVCQKSSRVYAWLHRIVNEAPRHHDRKFCADGSRSRN